MILFTVFLLLLSKENSYAQEENNPIVTQGNRYVDFKIKGLEKYNARIERQQKHLLSKLKRKEKHFANKLKKNDSAAYAHYQEQYLSYDSIGTLAHADTGSNTASIAKKKNGTIDSLKKIQSFVDSKAGIAGNVPAAGKSAELNKLQSELNYKNYINDLIAKRTGFLKGIAGAGHLPGFTGIEKQVFYGKSKMKVFKEMNDDPSVAEDKALEYLQGTDGFDKYMVSGGSSTNMSGMDASQLAKMGYQTKQQLQNNLKETFGNNLSGIANKLGGQLQEWQSQQGKLVTSRKEIKDTKKNVVGLKNTEKPSFKVNPMRGLPFIKRIERQFNWQTSRATTNQNRPALLDCSVTFGFKHTPKLTYGLGAAYSEGLGESWQHIHFSFQGAGYTTYATWAWQYGIGAYAGYERMYKRTAFIKEKSPNGDIQPTMHNYSKYSESVLMGLIKSYNINSKYKGSIQLLYDVWWQQKESRTPIILRFVTVKK